MKEAIEKLHFDPKWFEYNLLDDHFFVRQIAFFDKVQDGVGDEDEDGVWLDSEHHRYCAFRTILSSVETLNDEQLRHYIELCRLDEDQAMAYAALGILFEWPGLNSDQRAILEDHPVFKESGHLERILYNRMLNELFSRPCTEELFEEIIARGDSDRQLTLVGSPHTSRPQLERLESEGVTRKTRNMARNRLRSRRT